VADFSGDLRPVPDPTVLTTAQLQREIAALKEVLSTRLDGMDRAMTLFAENIHRVPSETDRAIGQLKALHETLIRERFAATALQFASIQTQFAERDVRNEQMERKNDTALTAALNAAKEQVSQQNTAFAEATAKAETGFIKQIDQLITLFQNGIKSLDEKIGAAIKTSDDKIANLEKQLTMLVGTGMGQTVAQSSQQLRTTGTVGLLSLVAAVALGLAGIIVAVLVRHG